MAVNNLGKWKTATQMIALTILLASRDSRFVLIFHSLDDTRISKLRIKSLEYFLPQTKILLSNGHPSISAKLIISFFFSVSLGGSGIVVATGVVLLYISAWLAVWSLFVYSRKISKVLLR